MTGRIRRHVATTDNLRLLREITIDLDVRDDVDAALRGDLHARRRCAAIIARGVPT